MSQRSESIASAARALSALCASVLEDCAKLRAHFVALQEKEREDAAALRLQAVARGFLARRKAQKRAREDAAALRLQAAARGFLARRQCRALVSASLTSCRRPPWPSCVVRTQPVQDCPTQHHPVLRLGPWQPPGCRGDLRSPPCCGSPGHGPMAFLVQILETAAGRPGGFPWDRGETCIQCIPPRGSNASFLFVLVENKMKPRCKRLHVLGVWCPVHMAAMISTAARGRAVSEGWGDVMGSLGRPFGLVWAATVVSSTVADISGLVQLEIGLDWIRSVRDMIRLDGILLRRQVTPSI
jgi:hypothetical protein